MAEVKSEYIAVNDLRALSKDAYKLIFEGSRIRIAWAEGKRVWDIWETMLSAYDSINVESKATTLTKSLLNLQSYGTDRLGVNHDMAYTIDPTSISANTSTSSKKHSVTIKQTDTGKSVSVTATQAGRVATKTTYKTPTVTSTSISTVPASGNVTRKLTVYWSQVKETTYDNNTTSTETVTGSSTATVTSGSENNDSGAYISSGGVYVPSAGTTYYTSQRTAYTISQFNFTANGVSSGTVSRTVYVYQSANTRTSTTEYSVSTGTASVSTIANTGGSFSFSATCQSRLKYTYASESTGNGSWEDADATVSYSNGVSHADPSSFNGKATITATVDENFGSARNPRVTVKASDGTSDYTQVSQDAVLIEFYSNSIAPSVGSDGGTISLSLISRRNGRYWTVTKNDVVVSLSGASVSVTHEGDGEYTILVNVPSNSSTSSRSFTVSVSHPDDGDTVDWTVSQEGKVVEDNRGKVRVGYSAQYTDSTATSVLYSVFFDATNTSLYKGGTLSNVTVELNASRTGASKAIDKMELYSGLYVAEGTKSETTTDYLTNNSGSSLIYFIVRYDGEVKVSSLIATPMD